MACSRAGGFGGDCRGVEGVAVKVFDETLHPYKRAVEQGSKANAGRLDLALVATADLKPLALMDRPSSYPGGRLCCAIFVGLFGSPVGSHNFAIIFVWIAWWTALKLVFIPLGGAPGAASARCPCRVNGYNRAD